MGSHCLCLSDVRRSAWGTLLFYVRDLWIFNDNCLEDGCLMRALFRPLEKSNFTIIITIINEMLVWDLSGVFKWVVSFFVHLKVLDIIKSTNIAIPFKKISLFKDFLISPQNQRFWQMMYLTCTYTFCGESTKL